MAEAADSSILTLHRTTRYSSAVADELKLVRDGAIFVDFRLVTKQQSVPCHKLILALHSPVLKEMLVSELVHSGEEEVRLDHIPLDILHIILDYMYYGTVSLHKEQLQETLLAADFLQIAELKDLCVAEAEGVILRINVTSWWKLATKLRLEGIHKHCKEFIEKDFYKVTKQPDFLGLTHGELQHYLDDVVTDKIHGDDVLDAVLRWVKQDQVSRLPYLDDVTELVDLERCTVQYMKSALQVYESMLDEEPKMYKKLSTALVNVQTQQMLASPGPTVQALLIVGGKEENVILSNQSKSNIKTACWKLQESGPAVKLSDIPYRLRQHSACQTPMGFAVTGGDQCFMFITALNAWSRMANMHSKRTGHGSICHGNTLMIFGGWQRDQNTASMELMELTEGVWKLGPDIPAPCRFPKLAQLPDDPGIYLLCEFSCELFFLDVQTLSWSRKAKLPVAYDCAGCSMTATRGMLYVAGGKFRIFASYNPESDTWCLGPQPAQYHIYGPLVAYDDRLLLLGGGWRHGSDDIEEYDFTKAEWSTCEKYRMPPSPGLYIHSAVVLPVRTDIRQEEGKEEGQEEEGEEEGEQGEGQGQGEEQ